MEQLKEYVDNSISFNYLKNYYNSLDVADIFGVSDMEIKHSNFLKWILQPSEENSLSYFPIRQLLKLIQSNIDSIWDEYNKFKQLDLEKSTIANVDVVREKHNIDFVISLTIEKEDYVIAMENKIESAEGEEQLSRYRKIIDEKYPTSTKLFVLLHPSYQQLKQIDKRELLKDSANKNKYASITYQNVYDVILKEYLKIQNDSESKFIIYNYIHTLSCYSSNRLFGLIVNDVEKENLEKLFNDEDFINIVEDIKNNIDTFKENKEVLIKICDKYKLLKEYEISEDISRILRKLESMRIYKFDGYQPKTIYEFAYIILNDIVKNKSIKTEDDFGEELKNYVFGKSWYLHKWEEGIENVIGGIMNIREYPPIIIEDCTYYSTKFVSYLALIKLCNLVVDRFPEYKDIIELV